MAKVIKTIAVVGGAGFMGSHAADALSSAGYNVRVFDKTPSKWIKNNQTMIIGDLLDTDALERLLQGCDVVFHFAGLADLNQALDKPLEAANINILGTISLLEACRRTDVNRFIFASTMYAYSRDGGFYRCSKIAAEEYIREYQHRYGLDYTIMRFSSLYGPRSNESNNLYRIIKEASQTGLIHYKGNKDAIREYLHVYDMANTCVEVLEASYSGKTLVLTGQETKSILDILEILAEILDIPSDTIEFTEDNENGHYIRTPYALKKPNLAYKYSPSSHIDIGQGLMQLIEDVQKTLYLDKI